MLAKSKAGFLTAFSIPLFVCMFMNEDSVTQFSFIFFLFQFVVLLFFLFSEKSLIVSVNPLSLTLLYILISFGLGSWAFSNDLVYSKQNLADSKKWVFIQSSTFIVLSFNFIVFYILNYYKHKEQILEYSDRAFLVERSKLLLYSVIFITFPFLFFDFDLAVIGGSGGISIIPRSLLFLCFIYYLAVKKSSNRFFLYALVLVCFSAISYEDKRDAIFFIFPIIFLESLFNGLKLNFRGFLYLILTFIGLIFLIIVMSISRGYGGYETESFFDSIYFVSSYLSSDFFVIYFFNNIEVNYTYFHTMQALEFIQQSPWVITLGTTLLKFLFLIIPRDLFPNKPDSFIDLYTTMYDPSFRAIGGSWPPNFYAELFWNFSFLSAVFVVLFFYIFNLIYSKACENVFKVNFLSSILFIYFIYLFLSLIRGSGFDLFIFNFIIAFVFSFLASVIAIFFKVYLVRFKR